MKRDKKNTGIVSRPSRNNKSWSSYRASGRFIVAKKDLKSEKVTPKASSDSNRHVLVP
jgi:hypothetical protein